MISRRINSAVVLFFLVVTISSEAFAVEKKLEAENATLNGVTFSSNGSGYSGMGYVTGFDQETDNITFNFTIQEGVYSVIIGYSVPNGEKGYNLIVNGDESSGMLTVGSASFLETNAGKFHLGEGSNTIVIEYGWGYYNIDYIIVKTATYKETQGITTPLVDPAATQATLDLYDFLKTHYGYNVISAQQDLNEITYVKTTTGLSPAIGGFDLIEYSPSRIEFGSNPAGQSESWIDWRNDNGAIITLMWHWNAPTDLINIAPGKEWWRGFYTEATTFNLTATLADKGGEDFQLILRDIDAIAVELKKFEDANIPVLWRPLHEASGGWFWWGAYGPDSFIELWQILFDRLKNHHGIHNLIWVYTAEDPDWYPGDEYVDIVGLDVYTSQSDNMSGRWDNILDQFDGNKIITLSETGTVPVPENIRLFGTWWSWFNIWNGNFIHNIDESLLTQVYEDEDIITLDELPDWDNYLTPDPGPKPEPPPAPEEITGLEDLIDGEFIIYPNPTHNLLNVVYRKSGIENTSIAIYDKMGRLIEDKTIAFQNNEGKTFTIDISHLKPSPYILKLTNEKTSFTTNFVKW